MREVEISEDYRVFISGTSEGTQDKYYKDGYWYKPDFYGGEGYNEELASKLLACSNLDTNDYVNYEQVLINNKLGCVSQDFCGADEEFVSIYRLYANINGGDIARVMQSMDMDDAIEYTLSFVKNNTGIDVSTYFANTIFLDSIILNTDRHMNNLGVIYNSAQESFRPAPIFDNGKSFFCGEKSHDASKLIFRPFSASAGLMNSYLKKYRTIDFNNQKVTNLIEGLPAGVHKDVLIYTMNDYKTVNIPNKEISKLHSCKIERVEK